MGGKRREQKKGKKNRSDKLQKRMWALLALRKENT